MKQQSNDIFKNRVLKRLLMLGIVLIVIPVIIYIIHFRKLDISNDVNDWSTFTDYISGILNPIIGLISLILLGYITYLVGVIGSKENKNLFVLQKKLEAYDEFASWLPVVTNNYDKLNKILHDVDTAYKKAIADSTNQIHNITINNDYLLEIDSLSKFNNFLNYFPLRYSHFFSYDFESDEYKGLRGIFIYIKELFTNKFNGYINRKEYNRDFKIIENVSSDLFESLNKVLEEFHKEFEGLKLNEKKKPAL
jgi:hypothetical protein